LAPFADAVEASAGVEEFYRRVTASFPDVRRPVDAFALHRYETEAYLDRFWGGLAREYRVDILAGSYFAVHVTGDGRLELRNRLLYYDRRGHRSYTQDKVYPTPFEYEFLGLRPGRLRAARPMVKRGVRIGISICNDTFYEAWEPHFRDIDIKANNADFTDETRALFRRALPARISGAEGTIGITVCLGGTFLDLFWEGPSSIIEGASTGYRVLRRASSPELPEILIADLGL
jgi:predicted amidohydrolase